MKKLFLSLWVIGAFFAGVASQASVPAYKTQITKEFNLSSDFGAGAKIYFNCSSVENQFESLLKTMGATNIQVKCSGGIRDMTANEAWDASVSVSFSALRMLSNSTPATQADFKDVKASGFDNCFLMTQLFGAVQASFEMKNLNVTQSCLNPNSAFHLQVSTLF